MPIICEQKSSEKLKITNSLLKKANKNGFGNNVGVVTNKCTNMYDVLTKFKKGTPEHEEMLYRIVCMQGYQQEIIDSIKGIIPKQVPTHWYSYKDVKIDYEKDEDEKTIEWKKYNQRLLANKKPYFFIYNYKKLMKKYKKYIENNNTSCLIKFGITLDELINKNNRNKDEDEFIKYYKLMMPVSMGKSLMNRLCWVLEEEYKNIEINTKNTKEFDYSFLKSEVKYSKKDKDLIYSVYQSYKKEIKSHASRNESTGDSETNDNRQSLINKYQKEVFQVCNNEDMVCDILLDTCYNSNQSKQFVWDICGDVIINRLLEKNNHIINIPIVSNDITNTYWQGDYYKIEKIKIEEDGI